MTPDDHIADDNRKPWVSPAVIEGSAALDTELGTGPVSDGEVPS